MPELTNNTIASTVSSTKTTDNTPVGTVDAAYDGWVGRLADEMEAWIDSIENNSTL